VSLIEQLAGTAGFYMTQPKLAAVALEQCNLISRQYEALFTRGCLQAHEALVARS
jgi:hypothetical protein